MDKKSLYIVCKTLDQPARIIGLPIDEFILSATTTLVFLLLGKTILCWALGLAVLIFMKVMKRGQGSGWLINVCYWYLPAFILKMFLRFTPPSHQREWVS